MQNGNRIIVFFFLILGTVEGLKIKTGFRFAMARGFLQFLMSECIAE